LEDGVEGEALMALALMRGPRRAQPHTDLVDGGFHQLTRGALSVDWDMRANDLQQVGAGERGLVDLLGRRGDARPIKRRARPRAARIGAPLRHQLRPRQLFRLGWARRLLRGRQLRRG
jgi:hypothetical protein